MNQSFVIRSSISSSLLKKVLFRGFCIALVGILLLLFAGIFIPASHLKDWGGGIFLISLALITWGLLPYRRLSKLQLKPNEIVITGGDDCNYYVKGRKIISFSLQSVDVMDYVDHSLRYGIQVWLKSRDGVLVEMDDSREAKKMRRIDSQGRIGLFFSYFSKRAYEELQEFL